MTAIPILANSGENSRPVALKNGSLLWSNPWSRKMNEAITDVKSYADGKTVIIASRPDPDIEGSSKEFLLTRFNVAGKMSSLKMKSQIKDLDVSEDGTFIVVSNYENQLLGLGPESQLLWTTEGMCKPFILNDSKKILCYHDDDAESDIAFDVLDWKGKKLFSYPISNDILSLKLSKDGKNLAMGLTGGQVVLLNSEFKPVWQKSVEGEVVDLAVSSEAQPKVTVLSSQVKKDSQKITVLGGADGQRVGVLTPSFHGSQVEIASGGNAVFYYGNGPQGQYLGGALPPFKTEKWKTGEPNVAEYFSIISVNSDLVWMGLEKTTEEGRQSYLRAYAFDGSLKTELPVVAEDEGAHLYTYQVSRDSSRVVAVTDDALLRAFVGSR